MGPVTCGPGSPQGKGQFLGLFCPSEMHCNSKSAENGDILSVQSVGQKNWGRKLMTIILSNLNRFKKKFH